MTRKESTKLRQKSLKNVQAFSYLYFYSVKNKQLFLQTYRFFLQKHLKRVVEDRGTQQIGHQEQRLDEERLDNGPAPRLASPQHLQLQSKRTDEINETACKEASLGLPLILIISIASYPSPSTVNFIIIEFECKSTEKSKS